jgi:hypothetical protein
MGSPITLPCDGCGRAASPEHIAARLRRLEWSTRFRPVHIQMLFLGGISPAEESEFLYAGTGEESEKGSIGEFRGEGKKVLSSAGLVGLGENLPPHRAEILAEFQHRGYYLTHILECPLDAGTGNVGSVQAVCERQLPVVLVRIRRSLRPKRIVLISQSLDALIPRFAAGDPAAALLLDNGKAFALDVADPAPATERLRRVLSAAAGPGA